MVPTLSARAARMTKALPPLDIERLEDITACDAVLQRELEHFLLTQAHSHN
jgi:hypothetical protein